ncbi:NrdH-redoxin [Leucobacter allii]|uniref:glutaredoxin domain-containing protein n=1 Tax=Leucobacter allii TaxID=2932247 RepID=UPI001FD2A7D3|nr:glutaredoxin domain-containing protein [Leucobacter allii]UOR02027.1 NrdH-redoxin [Leucobacter allii]
MIRVYTKPNCVQCDMTKRVLRQRGVEFEEDDIQDAGNLEAVLALGFAAAPVVHAGGDDIWAGFQPERLHAAIDRVQKENQ